jgi:environmental stress-induced protein Ves
MTTRDFSTTASAALERAAASMERMGEVGLKIIRRSAFKATPWKNGGGITHEAIRVPPTGDAFLWRVSVAQIDASGPFSDFSGYDRKMVLLQGRGVAVEFGGGEHRALRRIGDWVEFDGATPARCELLGGPCVDLNLMVSQSLRTAARIERLREPTLVAAARGETTLIFGIQDPLSLDCRGESVRLETWDLAILNGCSAHLSKMAPGEESAPIAVFIATISP